MGIGPSEYGDQYGSPSKGGASARRARQYVQPFQQPDPYDGMRDFQPFPFLNPSYEMQPQPAQPMNQIGDVMGTFGDVTRPAMPLPPPGQRLAGQENSAGLSGVTMEQALAASRSQQRALDPSAPTAELSFSPHFPRQQTVPPRQRSMDEQIRIQQMQELERQRQLQPYNAGQSAQYAPPPTFDTMMYSSPFGTRQSYRQAMAYQQPYQMPYQQPYQPPSYRPMSPFGGIAGLFGRMRGF